MPEASEKEKKAWEKRQNNLKNTKYLDQATLVLEIPEFPDKVISKSVICGFMRWKFTFFNKEIHPKEAVGPGRKRYINWKKKQHQKKKNRKRPAVRKARQGFLLCARCEPAPDPKSTNPYLLTDKITEWRAHALTLVYWKKPLVDRRVKKTRLKRWVFTHQVTGHNIKHYPGTCPSQPMNTLVIKLRVLRVSHVDKNAFPKINFTDAEDPTKICLKARDDCIYVKRTLLEYHSRILKEQIRRGEGTSAQNAIRIAEQFSPSLARVALKLLIYPYQPIFYVINIPELLEFAAFYQISAIRGIVEQKLIVKKCDKPKKGFTYVRKLELAYKHQLDGLINDYAKRLTSEKAIEHKMKMRKVPNEFKAMLKRKLDAINEKNDEIEANKAKRKQTKKDAKKQEKEAKKKAKLSRKFKKLKVSDEKES